MGHEIEKTNNRWSCLIGSIKHFSLRKYGIIEDQISREFFEFILDRFDRRCYNCGSEKKLTFDHNLPRSAGHRYTADNTVVLCHCCNSEKHDSFPGDFYGVGGAAELRRKLRENAKLWLAVYPDAKIIGTLADLKAAEEKAVTDGEFYGYSRKALGDCFYRVFGDDEVNRRRYFIVRSAAEKLTEKQKVIFDLYIQGLTQIEIKDKLGYQTQSSICKILYGNHVYVANGQKYDTLHGGIMQKLKKIIKKEQMKCQKI